MKVHQQSKNWNIQIKMSKKRTMFSLQKKETSSQKIQISLKSNAKISENMNKNNYDNRIMWIKMMLNDDVSITLFMIKHNKKLFINEWKNKIRIIYTIIK